MSVQLNFVSGKTHIKSEISNASLTGCYKYILPDIEGESNTEKIRQAKTSNRTSTMRRILNVELPILNSLIIDGEENEVVVANDENKENLELADVNVKTEAVEENNITPKYNTTFGTVKVKNESNKEITEETLMPNISLENNKDIVIFHTHTCESYTPSEKFNYEMTGTYRTTDLNYTVARVGTELEKYLKEYGYNIVHDKTFHDYPAYSGSYGRSLTTVENILNNSSAQMVIDLHRDAVRK